MKYDVVQVANKVIAMADEEKGDIISNLKLQKLLYYLQGYFLAVFDDRLFDEEMEAWQYGPVVSNAYHHFKDFGNGAISLKDDDEIVCLTDEEEDLFNEVIEQYGQFSAIKLMKMSHEEKPWKETFCKNSTRVISDELLKSYFKTELVNE